MALRGEEYTGRTVEEAIERGLHQLGRRRSDVDIEILDRGKPANMLGLGGEDARVMLTFTEDPAEAQPAIEEAEVPRRSDVGDSGDATLPTDAEMEIASAVLGELLEKLHVQADVERMGDAGEATLDVRGPELTPLIGRGGEHLVALQQIVSAIVSRRIGRPVHVPVDIAGYRRRREEQLRELGRRVAGRVRESGRPVTLEPMLAYERRIVHLAVQEEQGVQSESVGVDPNRRIMIRPAGAAGAAPLGPRPGYGPRPRPGAPMYGPRRTYGPRPGGPRFR